MEKVPERMEFDIKAELDHVAAEIGFGVQGIEIHGENLSFRIPEGDLISITLSRAGFKVRTHLDNRSTIQIDTLRP
jgi:hypothetical protein